MKIIWGDIVKEPTDALVTLASREARVGSGVDKSVHAAAGPELLTERLSKAEKMGPGIATFTKSYGLRKTCGAKNVIHISSVLWEGGGHDEGILLDAAYLKAVVIANALEAHTVTIPVMGAGKYGMPKDMALNEAVRSLRECSRYFPDMEIKLTTVENEIYEYAQKRYPELCESHFTKEEEESFKQKFPLPKPCGMSDFQSPWLYSEDETEYWKNLKLRQFERIGNWSRMFTIVWNHVRERDAAIRADQKKNSYASEYSGLSRPLIHSMTMLKEVSGVSKSTLKHILNGESACPSRDVVLSLCVAFGLPIPYVRIMLRTCGYAFKSDLEEQIVAACIRRDEIGIEDLNRALEAKLGKTFILNVAPRKRKKKSTGAKCVPRQTVCKNRRQSARR